MQTENNIVKNSNWWETNQLAIYKTLALEQDLNLEPPDYTFGAPNH